MGLAALAALLSSRLCEVAEEDAFIYYRYALNAIRGLGFAFNPPVRVEGFSSPLWMFLLTGVAGFAQDLHVAARIAGLIVGGAAVGATVPPGPHGRAAGPLEHAGVARLASSEVFLRRYRLIAEVGPAPLVRAFALAPGAPPRTVGIESCF